MTLTGILFGLGAGIGYGLYSILGTIALRRYSALTVTTYTFLFAAAGALAISHPAQMATRFSAAPHHGRLAALCILTALVTAVIPFLAYTVGLRSVEASRAGILATLEPVVATIIGMVAFAEPVTALSGVGILLVLSAGVLVNTNNAANDD